MLTDIHESSQAAPSRKSATSSNSGILIEADRLLIAAAKTGRIINVKKAQFLSPWDMSNVVDKVAAAGNEKIILTERGASFGYNNLVVDMRSFPVMQKLGIP